MIEGFRKGAQQVIDAAYRFGLGFSELKRPDGHEAGRSWFPALSDRLHLGAVVSKCGSFCAHAEALVKNLRFSNPAQHLNPDRLWPEEASELVERYNRHLGIDFPQHDHALHQDEKVEEDRDVSTERRSRDDGLDWGL